MTAPKPRRRTIRFAIVAVVCLLLGAVTTVAVGWGIEFAGPGFRAFGGRLQGWPRPVPDDWGWSEAEIAAQPEYILNLAGPGRRLAVARLSADRRMEADLAGWPFLALASVRGINDIEPWPDEWRFVSFRAGLGRNSWSFDPSAPEWLPVMPTWPGFTINTALYGLAWYLLIFTPLPLIRAGRRRFRVSRGMCGSCGYDLRGSPGGACPECGSVQGAKA